jgi:transposase
MGDRHLTLRLLSALFATRRRTNLMKERLPLSVIECTLFNIYSSVHLKMLLFNLEELTILCNMVGDLSYDRP